MDQSDNGTERSTYLSIQDNDGNINNKCLLDSTSLIFKKNDLIVGKYSASDVILNDDKNNSVKLSSNSLVFKDEYLNTASISQANNQIVFNGKSHIDTGKQIIDNTINTSTIYFTSPYPSNYIPQVFLQQFNTTIITPQILLVTNITNINFTWKSSLPDVGSVMWIAF
jgi:hypothetical protein